MPTDETIQFPLMSEDGDWYAFPPNLTRHEVLSELAHSWLDWWLDEYTIVNDDDTVSGWAAGYRSLIHNLDRGFIRPQSREEDGEWFHELDDWWHECDDSHQKAMPVWIWKDR